jgi:hypothetical protein
VKLILTTSPALASDARPAPADEEKPLLKEHF